MQAQVEFTVEPFVEGSPGDHVTAHYTIESLSPVKQTGLGEGRFITLLKHYLDQDGELVCEERFRLLRFKPKAKPKAKEETK